MTKGTSLPFALAALLLAGGAAARSSAQPLQPVDLAGTVTEFTPSTLGSGGSITIAGVRLEVAPGVDFEFRETRTVINNGFFDTTSVFSDPAEVIGTGRRIRVYVDAMGRIISAAAASGGDTTRRALDTTGLVSAFVAPTASAGGSVTINNLTLTIAPGATFTAPVVVGAVQRIDALLDAAHRIRSRVEVTAGTMSLDVCGQLRQWTHQAMARRDRGSIIGNLAHGSIQIDSASLTLAPFFFLEHGHLLSRNANVCLSLTLNQFGDITAPSAVTKGNGGGNLTCGVVTDFRAATPLRSGSLELSWVGFSIAPGQTLSNQRLAVEGARVCLASVYTVGEQTGNRNLAIGPPTIQDFALLGGSFLIPAL